MRVKIVYIAIGLIFIGILIGVLVQQRFISNEKAETNDYLTCNEACVERGYTQGNCLYRITSKASEVWCSEQESTSISGKFSDCHEKLMEVTKGKPAGGGGFICCCK